MPPIKDPTAEPKQPAKRGRPPKSATLNGTQKEVESTEKTASKLEIMSLEENIDPSLFAEQPQPKRQKLIEPPVPIKKKVPPRPAKKVAPKPLFSAKAMRSNFNPLPKTLVDYGSPEALQLNPRCANPLNSFEFDKHPWIQNSAIDSHFVLIFGAGDMGQMGLGTDKLEDVRKPAVHTLIEELKKKEQAGAPMHLAGGGMHTLVVDSLGKIWSWGINDNAALGRQTEGIDGVDQEELETRPMTVSNLSPKPDPASNVTAFKASRVSAGDSVSVAINEEGELVAWGSFRSNDGLLGFDGQVGTSAKQLTPTRVSNLREYPVAQVVCGYDHVLALTTNGQVYSWGNGQQQQLGRKIIERRKKNGLTPERLALKKIVLVGTGGSHSFAVNEDGQVFGWGLNTRGQLGLSPQDPGWDDEIVSMPTPVRTMNPENHAGARVIAIEGGDFHTLFLLNNGQVWAVGSYENGEIGVKRTSAEIEAVEEARREGTALKKAFVEEEMKARRAKFEKALGRHTERAKRAPEDEHDDPPEWLEMEELMEAEQAAASQGFVPGQCLRAPVRLDFDHPIIDISCGTRHNLAVDDQGNAYSWGLGQSNELGQGKDEDGEEIEMLESPKLLTSKALSQASDKGKLKVTKCAAGGTHSLLIAVNLHDPPKSNGS